jgi:hypothetical protein
MMKLLKVLALVILLSSAHPKGLHVFKDNFTGLDFSIYNENNKLWYFNGDIKETSVLTDDSSVNGVNVTHVDFIHVTGDRYCVFIYILPGKQQRMMALHHIDGIEEGEKTIQSIIKEISARDTFTGTLSSLPGYNPNVRAFYESASNGGKPVFKLVLTIDIKAKLVYFGNNVSPVKLITLQETESKVVVNLGDNKTIEITLSKQLYKELSTFLEQVQISNYYSKTQKRKLK